MIILFFFLILLPIFILIIRNTEYFQERGYILADINSHKNIKVTGSIAQVSNRVNGKEICIDNVCLTKNELKLINELHPQLKKTICINDECNYKKHFDTLKNLWPIGSIVMYNNSDLERLPDGWQICDGSMGTPDLRDRFVLGADKNYRYTYKLIGKGTCSNNKGIKPTYFSETNNKDFVNTCIEKCNNHKNCYGYNKNDTDCILWTEEINETKLLTDDITSVCFKKNTHGGENEHTLTMDEIPEHGHMLFSNNPTKGKGKEKGMMAMVSEMSPNALTFTNKLPRRKGIVKNKSDFHTKLSFTGDSIPHENKPPFYSLFYVMKIDPDYKELPMLSNVNNNFSSPEDILRSQIISPPINQEPIV